MSIAIGQKAPDFTLYSSEKKQVSLSDFRGKNVVMLFIPAAFTGVCTREFCAMRDEEAEYNALNAEVLGLSVDMLYSLAKWKEQEAFNFTLLSDFNKEVSRAYDSLLADFAFNMHGVSKRSVFVIDKEGIIRHMEIMPTTGEMPDLQKIKDTLATLN